MITVSEKIVKYLDANLSATAAQLSIELNAGKGNVNKSLRALAVEGWVVRENKGITYRYYLDPSKYGKEYKPVRGDILVPRYIKYLEKRGYTITPP